MRLNPDSSAAASEPRSHKKLDPEIKALRALNRAMESVPPEARQRCMEWFVNAWTGRSDLRVPRVKL